MSEEPVRETPATSEEPILRETPATSEDLVIRDTFFQAGGTLESDWPSYIVRAADSELLDLTLAGRYCNVLAARQVGKSSLMVRTQKSLNRGHVRSIIVDLTAIGAQGVTPDQWYYSVVSAISRRLGLNVNEGSWWEARQHLGLAQRFTEFLRDVVLKQIREPIVIFFDEIDSTLSAPFTDDFFAAIRRMYNERATNHAYRRLTFVLVGVARPADLIKDHRRTPYNIGRNISLDDFTPEDAKTLLPGLREAYPDQAEAILDRVLYWTGGHPYLTQRVCAELVQEHGVGAPAALVDPLIDRLFFREGQIRQETNLQRIDDYINKSRHADPVLRIYREILSGNPVEDDEKSLEISRLKLSGLVKAGSSGHLRVRNRIYERVFDRDWARLPTSPEPEPGTQWLKVVVPALIVVSLIVLFVIYQLVIVPSITTPTPTALPPTGTPVPVTSTGTPKPSDTPTVTATASPVADKTVTTQAITDATATASTQAAANQTATAQVMANLTATARSAVAATATADIQAAINETATAQAIAKETATAQASTEQTATAQSAVDATATAKAQQPTPTTVPITPLPGNPITASEWATIYARPDVESEELGSIAPNERVRAVGRARQNWIYIRRDKEPLEGFVWGPLFVWDPLEIVQIIEISKCQNGIKQAGLDILVQGGNGDYTFFWGDRQLKAAELGFGHYQVFWPWADAPTVDALKIVSGDEQTAIGESIYIHEPKCSP